MYFFGNIGEENVFYDVLEQKRPFYTIKKQEVKKSKNCEMAFSYLFL